MNKIRKIDTGEIFYNRIEGLIKNILVDNINYHNGHYVDQNLYTFKFKKDTIERAEYILKEMEEMKHLIIEEKEVELNQNKYTPLTSLVKPKDKGTFRINFENKRKEKQVIHFEDLINGECFYALGHDETKYLLMKILEVGLGSTVTKAIYLSDGTVCTLDSEREVTPVKTQMIIEE